MPAIIRRESYSSQSSTSSSRDSRSRRSDDSYYAPSSAPTSTYAETRQSDTKAALPSAAVRSAPPRSQASRDTYDDLPMGTTSFPRSSSETYDSSLDDQDEDLVDSDDDEEEDISSASSDADSLAEPPVPSLECIPPLPPYRASPPRLPIRASNPHDFARLFPSMNRLSIRHDEFTSDGNMNLRVDDSSSARGCATQLFHLRMYDLARREFSLRRYCRDSGREVASAKRQYHAPITPKAQEIESNGPVRPTVLKRSMTSAMKIMTGAVGGKSKNDSKPPFKRTNSGGSIFSNRSSSSASSQQRPGTANSAVSTPSLKSRSRANTTTQPLPTNTLKLEFSNYARVELHRRGSARNSNKRYEFEWWGHQYSWRRATDKHTGAVSFHLLRDSSNENKGTSKGESSRKVSKKAEMVAGPVAHIVPETRSPTQERADEVSGGWIPPCHFWISDRAVLDAMTDVADVIMATGLMALVDDCIKERWQTRARHIRRISVPLTHKTVDFEYVGPKAFVQGLLSRRSTSERVPQSPLRYGDGIAAC